MASIIDRLLGRTETKAVTGPGVYTLQTYPHLRSRQADPMRRQVEGMALFHSQPWVNAAERALGGRFVRMDWHLETADGDTVGDDAGPAEKAVLDLLERPSPGKTRRQLWGLTFRHVGLAGNAIWYLDQTDRETGAPLVMRYINPARMTPVYNPSLEILGWVLDDPSNPVTGSQGQPGVPFDANEIVHFTLDEPDWGVLGVGIPEAAQRKIELDRLADTHVGGVLGSGGRLTGLITPKAGVTVQDEQWVQFTRDWRRISEDPDAAKRLQVAKMPLDFTQMTASPKDLQLTDIGTGSRDDILAIWSVPKAKLGMPTPVGLGDRKDTDEATIWDTIKARSEGMREKIQFEVLDRFALGLQLVFDYPEFDDETPLFERAATSRYIALTNDERRAVAGFDPLDDNIIGSQVWIDQGLVLLDKAAAPPEPTPPQLMPFQGGSTMEPTAQPQDNLPSKARLDATRLRAAAEKRYQPRIQDAMRAALADQRGEVVRHVRKNFDHLVAKKAKDTDAWWSSSREDKRLSAALLPIYDDLATETARNIRATFAFPAKADLGLERILKLIRAKAAARISGINDTTRDAIAKVIASGVADGYTITDLANAIETAAPFDAARADLVARTETMLAYNESALTSYSSLGAEEVQAIDGDVDEECAARDGRTYSVEDAYGITDHPNGTLDWVPVVKAAPEPEKPDPVAELLGMFKAVLERPAPPITIHPADVHVYPSDVNVHVPEQKQPDVNVYNSLASSEVPVQVDVHVPESTVNANITLPDAKATTPAEVIVTQMPERIHSAIRDAQGNITGSIEGDR